MTKAEAMAFVVRWAAFHEARFTFLGFLAGRKPTGGAISSEEIERLWREACAKAGLAQATADEMRDPVARRANLTRALKSCRIPGRARRKTQAFRAMEEAIDEQFERWRRIYPALN